MHSQGTPALEIRKLVQQWHIPGAPTSMGKLQALLSFQESFSCGELRCRNTTITTVGESTFGELFLGVHIASCVTFT